MMFKKKSGLRIAGMMLLAAVLTFCPSDTVKTVYATLLSPTIILLLENTCVNIIYLFTCCALT